jgi:hydrogenase maturation factor
VPISPETQALCDHFGLDPFGLLASGALLIAVGRERLAPLQASLATAGIPATTIGTVVAATEGRRVALHGQVSDLPRFTRDEITRLFD